MATFSVFRILIVFLLPFTLKHLPRASKINPRFSCQSPRDCPDHSFCESNKQCSCSNGFVPEQTEHGLRCLKVPTIFGESCESDLQCKKAFGFHAACRGSAGAKECLCDPNAHFTDGLCYISSKIGEKCNVDENCHVWSTGKGPRAHCERGSCACPPHRHPNPDATECLPSSGLDEKCGTDEDCVVPSSRCLGVCSCTVGFVQSINKDRCLPAVDELDGVCEEDRQCTEYLHNAMCDPNTRRCTCAPYAHQVHKACWVRTDLHDSCENPYECYIPSYNLSRVHCSATGKCECVKGHVPKGKDCVPGIAGRAASSLFSLALVLSVVLVL